MENIKARSHTATTNATSLLCVHSVFNELFTESEFKEIAVLGSVPIFAKATSGLAVCEQALTPYNV